MWEREVTIAKLFERTSVTYDAYPAASTKKMTAMALWAKPTQTLLKHLTKKPATLLAEKRSQVRPMPRHTRACALHRSALPPVSYARHGCALCPSHSLSRHGCALRPRSPGAPTPHAPLPGAA